MTDETPQTAKEAPEKVVARLIASNAAGEATGYGTEELNNAYLNLTRGAVCPKTDALLKKIIGEDWADGLDADDEGDDEYDAGLDQSVAETIESVTMREAALESESLSILASALMMTSRELGWIETSRAAHELWFRARPDVV